MHELSIALSLLDDIEETAAREGAHRVGAIHLKVGALTGIAAEALRFSWELAASGTVADGSVLHIEHIPLAVRCEGCDDEVEPASAALICPLCGRASAHIVRGRELELVAMEVLA